MGEAVKAGLHLSVSYHSSRNFVSHPLVTGSYISMVVSRSCPKRRRRNGGEYRATERYIERLRIAMVRPVEHRQEFGSGVYEQRAGAQAKLK
jgi:hypothetical protein